MNQKSAGYAALSALLLGLLFLGGNLYLDANNHPTLASLFFMLAIFSELAFVVLIVIWVFIKSWNTESPRPGMPMPGPGGNMKPGMPMMKAGMPMPGPVAAKKPPPPQA